MNDIDKKIAQKIADSFKEYADGMEDQGWARLREKYPPRRERRPVAWWLSAAAVLIFSIGIALYFLDTNEQAAQVAKAPKGRADSSSLSSTQSKPDAGSSAETTRGKELASVPAARTGEVNRPATATSGVEPANTSRNDQKIAQEGLDRLTASAQNGIPAKQSPVSQAAIPETHPATVPAAGRNDFFPYRAGSVYPEFSHTPVNGTAQPLFALPKPSKAPATLTESPVMLADAQPEQDLQKEKQKTSFDLYTSAFLNYAAKSNTPLNAGAGFNASIPVAGRLDIVLGGGISNNSAHFGKDNLPAKVADNYSSRPQSISGGNSFVQNSVSGGAFDAQLVAIDIPIAFKLYLAKSKKVYLLTGVNSSSYLSERYAYQSSSFNNAQGFVNLPDQVDKSSFGSFDFARSGLFAFGAQVQLGKTPLLFETYYKPAFGGLGQNRIRLNSAGINLRIPLKK